jgi:hypothetical protein
MVLACYLSLFGCDRDGNNGFVLNGKLSVANNLSIRPEVATYFDFNDSEDISYLVSV